MASRTLETILTGKNELSPVLAAAAKDVATYDAAVRAAHTSTGQSATEAADKTVEANRRVSQSSQDTNEKMRRSSADAAKQIAAMRAELLGLGQIKAGASVDVDTIDARAKLIEIRGKLSEIAGEKPTARVQADVEAASVQLRVIQAELNRIDGQKVTATVDVDDRGSLAAVESRAAAAGGSMFSLTGAALAVSPALVPIGAAAAAGLGGIAGLAAAGAGGLGVLAVAIAGVANAVKLIGQQQDAAAAQSVKAAGSSVSSAAAIRSAEASLANTRANAADQAVTAAESVARAKRDETTAEQTAARSIQTALDRQAQAEQSLAAAQRDETAAQKDLTAARQTAKQQIEDLANQVTDNALAQRQAVLDVADAKTALDKVLADPAATAEQREQAQITYAQQLQQQRELGLSGQRLADQKAQADRQGVEGATVVTDATQRLADAQRKTADAAKTAGQASVAVDQARVDAAQKVADAQAKVTDAVRQQATQQRQSAFAIAQAQDAVASAMRSSGSAGSTSLDSINRKLADLDPATRNFAEYLIGTWKPLWGQIKTAAAGGLLPGVRDGLDAVRPLMPQITGLVGDLSATLGGLASEAGHALAGPYWAQFFAMIRRDAGPLLSDLGHTLGNLAHGFAGVLEAFEPMSLTVGAGLESLSGKFAAWGEALKTSDGFQRFVAYVRENWPKIEAIIGNVGGAIVHLIEGAAPLGGEMLSALQMFSGVLANLPVGVMTALVGAVAGLKVASTVAGGMSTLTEKAVGTVRALSGNADAGNGALKVMGKLGAALPIAGAAFGIVESATKAAAAQMDSWAQSMLNGGQAADAARASAQHYQDVSQAGLGGLHSVGDAWDRAVALTMGYTHAADDATGKARALYEAMTPQQQAAQDVTKATNDLQYAIKLYGEGSPQAVAAADALRDAQGRQKDQTDKTKFATEGLTGAIYDNVTASEAAAGSALGFQSSLMSTQGQIEKFTQGIKDGTLKNADRKKSENDVAQSILQTVQAAGKQAEADNAGKSAAEIHKASVDAQRNAFEKLTGQLGYVPGALQGVADSLATSGSEAKKTADRMDDLRLKVSGLPNGHSIVIDAPTGKQMQDLEDLGFKTRTLPKGKVLVDADTKAAQDTLNAFLNQQRVVWVGTAVDSYGQNRPIDQNGNFFNGPIAGHRAAGGPITGPGTGTSDTAGLYALSHGEWVVKASSSDQYGPQKMAAINAGTAQVTVPGLANGGPILSAQMDPATLTAANSQILGLAQRMAQAAALAPNAPANVSGNKALGQQLAAARGWGSGAEWNALYALWQRESGWRNTAQNPTSTAYGIPQFLDSTWASVGLRKTSDAATQIRGGLQYIAQRFHDPIGAWAHEQKLGWYGNGGIVNGAQLVGVGEDGPEAIVPLTKPDRRDAVLAAAGLAPGARYNAAGTGFTAAASPGYGPAGSGAVIDYDRLAGAIARAVPAGGGTTLQIGKVEQVSGTPRDIAQELDWMARTGRST